MTVDLSLSKFVKNWPLLGGRITETSAVLASHMVPQAAVLI